MSLADLRAAVDGTRRTPCDLGNANYRVYHPGRKLCITYTTKQDAIGLLDGHPVRVPADPSDKYKYYPDESQSWTVRTRTSPSADNGQTVTISFPNPLVEHGHEFLLDFVAETPQVDSVTVSGISDVPNGLPPPQQIADAAARIMPITPPLTPAGSLPPALKTYARDMNKGLTALATGGATSVFQVLKTSNTDSCFIYSPATDTFLAFLERDDGTPGILATAVDVKGFIYQADAYAKINGGDADAFLKLVLDKFVWNFLLDDGGPPNTVIRLLDNSSGLVMADSACPVAQRVDPNSKSHLWGIFPYVLEGSGKIWWMASNEASPSDSFNTMGSTPTNPLRGKWRAIRVHPPGTKEETYVYKKLAPAEPFYFLIVDEADNCLRMLVSGEGDKKTGVLGVQSRIGGDEGVDANLRKYLHYKPSEIWNLWGGYIWRVFQHLKPPEDGFYTITTEDASKERHPPDDVRGILDIPNNSSSSDPTGPLLSPKLATATYSYSTWSQAWEVRSVVADNGSVFQTITNRRAGHILDYNPNVKELVGKKRGNPSDERWVVSSLPSGGYKILDYAVVGKAILSFSLPIDSKYWPGYGPIPDGEQRTAEWRIERVRLLEGDYYIVNAATGRYLSPNENTESHELVTTDMTSPDLIWKVQGGGELKAIVNSTKQTGIQAGAPSSQFPTVKPASPSTVSPAPGLTVSLDASNYGLFIVILPRDSDRPMLAPHSGFTPDGTAFQIPTKDDAASLKWRWRFVPAHLETRQLPTWSSGKTLDQGVYRITSALKLYCSLQLQSKPAEGPTPVLLTDVEHPKDFEDLWHVQKDVDGFYTLRNLSSSNSAYLGEAGSLEQTSDGNLACASLARSHTQHWSIIDVKPTNSCWALQNVVSGAFMDTLGSEMTADSTPNNIRSFKAGTTPLLTNSPMQSQTWSFERVVSDLSSGIYRIMHIGTGKCLSGGWSSILTLMDMSKMSELEKCSCDWQITRLPMGCFYTVRARQTLNLLTADAETDAGVSLGLRQRADTPTTASEWIIRPAEGDYAFTIENVQELKYITGSGENVIHMQDYAGGDSKSQRFTFKRIDKEVGGKAYDHSPSAKFGDGHYTFLSADRKMALFTSMQPPFNTYPTLTSYTLNAAPEPLRTYFTLNRAGSGGGCYTLSTESGTLIARPDKTVSIVFGGIPGCLDEGCWKIIRTFRGHVRIINKASGLMMRRVGDYQSIVLDIDGPAREVDWELRDMAKYVSKKFKKTEIPNFFSRNWGREVNVSNGIYIIKSTSWLSVLTAQDPSGTSATDSILAPRDFGPASIKARLQVCLVEKQPDGWYRISSFPTGHVLATSGEKAVSFSDPKASSAPTSDQKSWKFVRAGTGQSARSDRVRLVCRDYPLKLLKAADATKATMETYWPWKEDEMAPLDWNLILASSLSLDEESRLPEGTYTVSCYGSGYENARPPSPIISFNEDEGDGRSARIRRRQWPTTVPYKDKGLMKPVDGPPTQAPMTISYDFDDSGAKQLVQLPLMVNEACQYLTFVRPKDNPFNDWSLIIRASADGAPAGWLYDGPGGILKLVKLDDPYPTKWRAVYQPTTGGWALFSGQAVNNTKVLAADIANNRFITEEYISKDDGSGKIKQQRWKLSRRGYYIQNQSEGMGQFQLGLHTNEDPAVLMRTYLPFPSHSQESSQKFNVKGLNTWLLAKAGDTAGKLYKLINEHTGYALGCSKSNQVLLKADGSPDYQDFGGFSLVRPPNATDKSAIMLGRMAPGWKSPIYVCASKTSGGQVVFDVLGMQPAPTKTWRLVPVSATDRGDLTDMPRVILALNDAIGNGYVYSANPVTGQSDVIVAPYNQDDSYQRWRIVSYSNYRVYFNEATGKYLDADLNTHDMKDTGDIGADSWFPYNAAKFGGVLSNTGDLPPSIATFRIGVAKKESPVYSSPPMVLGYDSTTANKITWQPLDVTSPDQLFTILDWERGRWIRHLKSSKLLALDEGGTDLVLVDGYQKTALWQFDMRLHNEGFVPLINDTKEVFWGNYTALARYVRTSSKTSLFANNLQLQTFLKSRLPIFVHQSRTNLPIKADSYIQRCAFFVNSAETMKMPVGNPSSCLRYDPNKDKQRTVADAECYVVVRNADDPLYTNYTDIVIWYLYVSWNQDSQSGGWSSLTLRFNNETSVMEAVKFPAVGWVPNCDLNCSSLCVPANNPLKICKRNGAAGQTRVHVYVDADGTFWPNFPEGIENNVIVDDTKWGGVVDAGASYKVAAADAEISAIVEMQKPDWMSYAGSWNPAYVGERALGPRSSIPVRDRSKGIVSVSFGSGDDLTKTEPAKVNNLLTAMVKRQAFDVNGLPNPGGFIDCNLAYVDEFGKRSRSEPSTGTFNFGQDILGIEYGWNLFDDQANYTKALSALQKSGSFPVSNTSLGQDPFLGQRKQCQVRYIDSGIERSRTVWEGTSINFGPEVLEIKYCGVIITSPAAYKRALDSLLNKAVTFFVDKQYFGCNPVPDVDVATKKWRPGEVKVRDDDGTIRTRTVYEGEAMRLAKLPEQFAKYDILSITYGGRKITLQSVFQKAFGSLEDYNIVFDIQNVTFGFDPLPDKKKTCEIVFRISETDIVTKVYEEGTSPRLYGPYLGGDPIIG